MSPESSQSVLDLLHFECLESLQALAAHQALVRRPWNDLGTREDLHFHLIVARETETMLAIRVCRVDDEGRGQVSLRSALNEGRPRLSEVHKREIDKRLKVFRRTINPIKVVVRNLYGAHRASTVLATVNASAFDLSGNHRLQSTGIGAIRDALREAVEIVDLLSGSRRGYTMTSGAGCREVDLRAQLAPNRGDQP